jgi:hypothetical protein
MAGGPLGTGAGAPTQRSLDFIRAVREDPGLRQEVEELDPADGLAPVVALAATHGFYVSIESLRAAHAHDFVFRLARYGAGGSQTKAAASPESTVAVVNTPSSM